MAALFPLATGRNLKEAKLLPQERGTVMASIGGVTCCWIYPLMHFIIAEQIR
jgi:hypothetical protein